jgi:hypothetical protein
MAAFMLGMEGSFQKPVHPLGAATMNGSTGVE